MNRPYCRRGLTLVWWVLLLPVLLGLMGLSLDCGFVVLTMQELQSAADAAALAGARYASESPESARLAAINFAGANTAAGASVILVDNPGNNPNGDVVLGHFDRNTGVFTAQLTPANAVSVTARRSESSPNGLLPLLVGPVFGVNTIEVSRRAIAMVQVAQGGPGMVILSPTGESMQVSSDANVSVSGNIQVNSTDVKALSFSGNGILQAQAFNVAGGIYQSGNGQMIGELNPGAPAVPDPFGPLPEPNPVGAITQSYQNLSMGNGTFNKEPGRYIGGIDISGNGTYNFAPGIYYIEGGGFSISGNGTVNLNGVLIYNSINSPGSMDQVKISSDATVNWTPIQGGVYEGFSIFQNRNVPLGDQKKLQISGNGYANIQGSIYAKYGDVQLSGDGPSDVLGGGFVAWKLQLSGNGTFNVGSGGGAGGLGPKVFLVQ